MSVSGYKIAKSLPIENPGGYRCAQHRGIMKSYIPAWETMVKVRYRKTQNSDDFKHCVGDWNYNETVPEKTAAWSQEKIPWKKFSFSKINLIRKQ